MNNTVAHVTSTRPSKSSNRASKADRAPKKPASAATRQPRASMFADVSEAREYGHVCLTEARETIAKMSAAVMIDEDDLDIEAFRRLASGLLTNIGGAETALDSLAAASPAGTSQEMAVSFTGGVVPLREAVDEAIAEIDSIVRSCRGAIDKAVSLHVYIAGSVGREDAFYPPSENPAGDFNECMAEAVGALQCLLSYVDPLRPEALLKARSDKALRGALRAIENDLDAAAEE